MSLPAWSPTGSIPRTIATLFAVLLISYSVLAVAVPSTTVLTLIYANLLVTFFAVFALRGVYYALLEETHTPKHLTGASVAVIAFIGYTPEIFFAPVVGRILDASPGVDGHLSFYTVLAAVAVVGVVVTLMLRRINKRTQLRSVRSGQRPV